MLAALLSSEGLEIDRPNEDISRDIVELVTVEQVFKCITGLSKLVIQTYSRF